MADDFINEFIKLAANYGMNIPRVVADNRRHRFCTHDKNRADRSGEYCLRIDANFAVGYIRDYRSGLLLKYSSRSPNLSPADADKIRQRIARERKKAEDEAKILAEKALAKSKSIWDSAAHDVRGNPYVIKKHIKPHNVRQAGGALIVPLYRMDGEVPQFAGVQRIWPDKKRFIYGLVVTGCFGCAGFNKDKSTIYITEGYATGCSIHEATGAHVIVAFNSGNLPHVAKIIRQQYPKARIIIAADNDQWTGEAGLKAAKAAAEIAGGDVAVTLPDVFFDDPARPTDFNDIHLLHGLDAVREMLKSYISLQPPEPEPEPEQKPAAAAPRVEANWREMLVLKKDGSPDSKSALNVKTIFTHHPAMRGVFCYDEFSDEIIVRHCPPWQNPDDFRVRRLEELDAINGNYWFDSIGLRIGKQAVMDGMVSIANEAHNVINPAKDYFESLQWDGKPRLDSWLAEWVGATHQPREYLAEVGRKTLTAVVTRAFKPGAKFDHMMILESRQGLGKSTLLKQLATIGGVEYFTDEIHDIMNKDSLIAMQGKLVVEFAELQAMGRSDLNDLKAFITRTVDEYRPPYGRYTIKRPRRCVFIGTVNPSGEYFVDSTGNRRFWPVRCGESAINHAGFAKIVPQLWAEAYQCYLRGEALFMTETVARDAVEEQEKRFREDAWTELIEEAIADKTRITINAIMVAVGVDKDRRDAKTTQRIHAIMKRLGWERTNSIREDGHQRRGFRKAEAVLDFEIT